MAKRKIYTINKFQNLEMIIFDMDGTIWDVADITYEAANEIMKKHNIQHEITLETIKNSMGCNFEECAYNYMPFLEKAERENLQTEIRELNNKKIAEKGGKIYPYLEDVLEKLSKNYKLAIVSNCGEGYIESFFKTSNLEKYFIDYIPASALKISKGEAIKEIMKKNKISNAIYVGDTKKDQEASEIAGVDFIYAKYGFGKNINSKYTIENLNDLLKVIES